jgi:hypothetical protein
MPPFFTAIAFHPHRTAEIHWVRWDAAENSDESTIKVRVQAAPCIGITT